MMYVIFDSDCDRLKGGVMDLKAISNQELLSSSCLRKKQNQMS